MRAGKPIDATVFDNVLKRHERLQVREYARNKVKASLYMRAGYIHPDTGEMMEPIYYGILPCYRLKHLANDKHHARSTGPIQLLTHQPTEGRARDGGHKIGIMESSNFDAMGVAAISQERLLRESDGRIVDYCQQCTQMAVRNDPLARAWYVCWFLLSIAQIHGLILVRL